MSLKMGRPSEGLGFRVYTRSIAFLETGPAAIHGTRVLYAVRGCLGLTYDRLQKGIGALWLQTP